MSDEAAAQVPMPEQLIDTCELFLEQTKSYRNDLEQELNEVKSETDPYIHHIRALEQLIPRAQELENLVGSQILPAAQEVVKDADRFSKMQS